jgi:hypothetical protein
MDFYALLSALSAEYFGYRYIWRTMVPSVFLTMLSGVFSFLAGSEHVSNAEFKQALSIVVGCFSFLATPLTTLGDFFKYGSQRDMHRSAATDLDAIVFEQKRTLRPQILGKRNES